MAQPKQKLSTTHAVNPNANPCPKTFPESRLFTISLKPTRSVMVVAVTYTGWERRSVSSWNLFRRVSRCLNISVPSTAVGTANRKAPKLL